jgi:hypothetical protein
MKQRAVKEQEMAGKVNEGAFGGLFYFSAE